MSQTSFDKVVEFNIVFGVPIFDTPQYDIFDKNPKLTSLRFGLIDEENKELHQAIQDKNMTEVLDALVDIDYVTLGAGASFGLNLDLKHNKIEHNPNKNIFHENSELVDSLYDAINNAVIKLKSAIDNKNMENVHNELINILYGVRNFGKQFGLDLDLGMDLVHKSNMTKSCTSKEEAIKTVKWYEEEFKYNRQPYDSPAYRHSQCEKYWVVYNKNTGKILKNINYEPVDFSNMLD